MINLRRRFEGFVKNTFFKQLSLESHFHTKILSELHLYPYCKNQAAIRDALIQHYLTFTLHVFVTLPDFIVIITVPFFLPFIVPVLDTVAIFLLEVLYVTASAVPT